MPASVTSVTRNATAAITTAVLRRPNDRGLRRRTWPIANIRDRTRAISVIVVLLLLARCQKRAAELSSRERSEFIPTWKQALAEWLASGQERRMPDRPIPLGAEFDVQRTTYANVKWES